MSHSIKTLATGACLSAFCLVPAYADGVDEMFTADGHFLGELEIVGDVVLPSGEEMTLFEMRDQHLKIYVHPDAAYVTMDPNNPIFTQQTPFYGKWMSTASPDYLDYPVCKWNMTDENGEIQTVHGSIHWWNTGIGSDGYSLAFNLDFSTCDDLPSPWAYSRAGLELAGLGGVPHNDIPPQDEYSIAEANGETFWVLLTDAGAQLTSDNGSEQFDMSADCSASSAKRGIGNWGWANGGFFVDFNSASFSFPRMDAPVEDGGRCRL
ncbi:hypothetical protein [Marivita geojedonensis]|uniref:Uncharacterized protein n=1 Tax=Marivita geojedonensis TaxID=1123756 RepID=A0A1X4NM54_9RHOB|nr:hypothetical protein [Marivita geojedonensis]OSQ51354.1 hypothetical protein MGEO_07700 [Marivita geojedonensis]PRY77995.1 hypothetical protein CLV76_107182 [Marivita geojedonensis]